VITTACCCKIALNLEQFVEHISAISLTDNVNVAAFSICVLLWAMLGVQ